MAQAKIAHNSFSDQALPIGTVLAGDQFTIEGHLGVGGFGITYRAIDNVLGRTIVIKECFPDDFCYRDGLKVAVRNASNAGPFRSIVNMFMREARSLAKLRHANVVGVHRAFEENNTAYMALDLIEGVDLFEIMNMRDTPLSPGRIQDILVQLLDAIDKIHASDLLHRDISPDNILIESTGTPVLIDFGAARADASRQTRAISSLMVVKDGYSPQEFYVAGSEQTPSSDLYALGATFYHLLTGGPPVNSQARMLDIAGKRPDPCPPLAGRVDGYDHDFLHAIDTAMQLHPNDRIQSAAKWRSMIAESVADRNSIPLPGSLAASNEISLDLERSLTRLVEETNDEVRRISQIPDAPKEIAPIEETPSRPEWVEEFNQESSITEINADAVEVEPLNEVEADDFFKQIEDAPTEAPEFSSRPTISETNWISRAVEKEERILSEQENALLDLEADPENLIGPDIPEPKLTQIEEAKPNQARNGRSGPITVALGLVICLIAVLFYRFF